MFKLNENTKNFGIGVDIESIDRFELYSKNSRFLNKLFTKNELNYCFSKKNSAQHLAARYVGKEAVIKALNSMGRRNLSYNEVEIFNDENNIPIVKINDKNYLNFKIHVSLSHSNDRAIAFSIVIGDKNG